MLGPMVSRQCCVKLGSKRLVRAESLVEEAIVMPSEVSFCVRKGEVRCVEYRNFGGNEVIMEESL